MKQVISLSAELQSGNLPLDKGTAYIPKALVEGFWPRSDIDVYRSLYLTKSQL